TAPPTHMSPRLLVQAWSSELELKLNQAKGRLAQKLQAQDAAQALQASVEQASVEQQQPQPTATAPVEQTAAIDESSPQTTPAVPLPRARPVEANLERRGTAPATTGSVAVASAQADDRTWLQK